MQPNKQYKDGSGVQYAMYPNPIMNITQSIDGYTSHRGTFAIDDAQEDTGISNGYAPCDMVCVATDYVNGNAMFWESKYPVHTKRYGITHIYMMVIHDNTANAYVGMEIPQGNQLFSEGTAGYATGNHNHIEVGIGHYPGYMYVQSGYLTSWGATVYMMPGNVNPSDVFFVDDTTIYADGDLNWSTIEASTGYEEIPEHYAAKFLVDEVLIHQDTPDGAIVGSVYKNDIVEYYAKTVYGGHRWIKDANNRWYAISDSETAGENMWVELVEPANKPEPTPNPDPAEIELIEEEGIATFVNDIPINIHRDTPNGALYGFMSKGEQQHYTHKYVGNGHRYVCWYYEGVLCFCAVSATEERPAAGSDDEWATFSAVVEEKPTEKPEQPEEKPDYTKNVKSWGIDISEHNTDINLDGQDFVIIRATYGENEDKWFRRNVERCQKANIPFGLYCYSYAINEQEMHAETEYFLNAIKGIDIPMGCWFDMEDADGWKDKHNCLTKEHCTKAAQVFCDAVSDAGYFVGVYSTPNWFENIVITDYPKWIAHWGTNDGNVQYDYSDQCVLYQYAANPIDKDLCYVDIADLASHPKPVEPEIKPEPEQPVVPPKEDEELNISGINKLVRLLNQLIKKILSIFK